MDEHRGLSACRFVQDCDCPQGVFTLFSILFMNIGVTFTVWIINVHSVKLRIKPKCQTENLSSQHNTLGSRRRDQGAKEEAVKYKSLHGLGHAVSTCEVRCIHDCPVPATQACLSLPLWSDQRSVPCFPKIFPKLEEVTFVPLCDKACCLK